MQKTSKLSNVFSKLCILMLILGFVAPIASADRTFQLPPQAGNSGLFLQTNGNNPLWASASATANPFTYPAATTTTLTSISSPYTVLSTDQIIVADTTLGSITINLPPAAGNVYRNIIVYKPSYANTVTINASGTDSINQTPSYIFTTGQTGIHLEAITSTEWLAIQLPATPTDTAVVVVNVTQTGTILPNTPTYSNGTLGVGATLTANANVALGPIDGVTLSVGQTLLVRSQADQTTNGVYQLTQQGTGSVPWILTRLSGQDTASTMNPQIVVASSGGAERGTIFVQTTPQTITVGTSSIVYQQTSVSGNFVTQALTNSATAGTIGNQYSTGIPTWNGIVRQLTTATNNFAYNPTGNVLSLGSDGITNYGQFNMNGQAMIKTGPVANQNMSLGYFSPAITAGNNQVFIAPNTSQNTNVSGSQNATVVGAGAGVSLNGGANNTFLGYIAGGTVGTGGSNTIIGSGADVSATGNANNTLIGASTASGNFSGVIAIGKGSAGTAANQFVAGSSSVGVTNVYFGNGVAAGAGNGTSYSINGSGAGGANKAGGNVTITGGLGTGQGGAGTIVFQAPVVRATSDSTAQSLSTAMTVNGGSNLSSPTTIPTVTAKLRDDTTILNTTDTSKVLAFSIGGQAVSTTTTIANGATTSQTINLPVTREAETLAVKPQVYTSLSTPVNPIGTTNTTGVMMGMGGTATITPQVTGRVLVTINGQLATNTATDGAKVEIRMGTGGAPSNGTAMAGQGTVYGSQQSYTGVTGALSVPFSSTIIVTGLTVGTAYWIDTDLAAVTGGTATITSVSISAEEM